MAYFHCLIGGGSGGGYELTVTCDADFAGTTITCTDGVTTLTQTCPSASPYEVVFAIPNGGEWTISGVVGGQTISTGVNIPTSAELIAIIQQTVTIHSAKEDTISYTDIDGATQTITFASGATSKQVQITINPNGSSITFTSSVAKNPDNLSQDYSKTFTITASTTDIYLMPDAVKTLYWWGYENGIEDITTANGWSYSRTLLGATHNSTDLYFNSNSSSLAGIASSQIINSGSTLKALALGVTIAGTTYGGCAISTSKATNFNQEVSITSSSLTKYEINMNSNGYFIAYADNGRKAKVNALWYE